MLVFLFYSEVKGEVTMKKLKKKDLIIWQTGGLKYVTEKVDDLLGNDLKTCLWEMFEQRQQKKIFMDSIQIFKLEGFKDNLSSYQDVSHSQNDPLYEESCTLLDIENPVDMYIWIAKSHDNWIMMLPEEYIQI